MRLVALAVLVVTMSCHDTTAPIFNLARARMKWRAQNLHTYEFTLQRSCYCLNVDPLQIVVVGDTVDSVVDLQTHASVDRRLGETVDDLFAFIQSAIDDHAQAIRAEFDAAKGFPTSIEYDGSLQTVDDEMSVRVSDVHPLSAQTLARLSGR
ncbi:MAG TPA: DUF6174 domain-containing protein [Gemmatimonadaceae bacterium]|jgi:hypothetical protein